MCGWSRLKNGHVCGYDVSRYPVTHPHDEALSLHNVMVTP